MKKSVVLLIAMLVISFGFLSGCNEQKAVENPSSKTTTYSSKLVYVNSDSQAKVEEVCVEIQNTGDNGAWFVVDFEFVVYDEENLGPGKDYGGGTTIYDEETYHIEKQVYVEAHKTNRVYCEPWSWKPAISLHDYSVHLN